MRRRLSNSLLLLAAVMATGFLAAGCGKSAIGGAVASLAPSKSISLPTRSASDPPNSSDTYPDTHHNADNNAYPDAYPHTYRNAIGDPNRQHGRADPDQFPGFDERVQLIAHFAVGRHRRPCPHRGNGAGRPLKPALRHRGQLAGESQRRLLQGRSCS
jgi:hypothetical protein